MKLQAIKSLSERICKTQQFDPSNISSGSGLANTPPTAGSLVTTGAAGKSVA